MNIASQRHILVRTKAKFDESFSGTKLRTSIYLRGEERKTKQIKNKYMYTYNNFLYKC